VAAGPGIFDLLVLIGRPASGKSEIVDYLLHLPPAERRLRFHVGELRVIDDFPMLWSWFEEDRILESMGAERLHTTAGGYFRQPYLWDLLVRRLCLEYRKRLEAEPRLHGTATVVLEFSRGSEHGGYRRAFLHLDAEVLRRASVLYVSVSFEESLRKNRRRFDPKRPHSILAHSLPDEKMRRLYREDDWGELSTAVPGYLQVQGRRVPCAVFENEDDLTTAGGDALGERLSERLQRLWQLRRANP
jgi:hypothetical protein